MSDKYRLNVHDVYARRKVHSQSGNMNKVTDAVVDIAKIAVVGSVAMGLAGAITKK